MLTFYILIIVLFHRPCFHSILNFDGHVCKCDMTHSFICIIGLMYIYGVCILDIFGLGCRGYWQTWQERHARGIIGIIRVLQCVAVCCSVLQ